MISAIIGCSFIYQYQNFDNFLHGDQIFLILLIPSLDMLRLFVVRIIKGKHPFKGDLKHLHHMVDGFVKDKNITILITIIFCIFPSLLMLTGLETYFILVLNLFIYLSLILFLEYKK